MSHSNFAGPNSDRRTNDNADSGPESLPFSWEPPVEPDAVVTPPASLTESSAARSSGALHTLRTAAAHMGVDPGTLRAQCRNATRNGGVADLGGGIIAFKVGRHWRVRFPWWQ